MGRIEVTSPLGVTSGVEVGGGMMPPTATR